MTDNYDSEDDIDGLLYDTFRNVVGAEGIKEGPNNEARKFYNLINVQSKNYTLDVKASPHYPSSFGYIY